MDAAVESVGLLVPFVCREMGLGISLLLARFRLKVGVRESWVESGWDCGVADVDALRIPLMEAMANVALTATFLFRCWCWARVQSVSRARLLEVDVQCDKTGWKFP